MMKRFKFPSEMIYLMGALRDGTIDIRNKKNYEIKIGQKDERWLSDVLKPIIENEFDTRVSVKKNLLRLTRKKVVKEIEEISGIKTHGWETPKFLKELSLEEIKPYIIGFWDAEGGLPKQPKIAKQKYISFHQKETEPLIFIKGILENLGYRTTNLTKCSDAFEFRITRKIHMKKFILEFDSRHPSKQVRLQELLETL